MLHASGRSAESHYEHLTVASPGKYHRAPICPPMAEHESPTLQHINSNRRGMGLQPKWSKHTVGYCLVIVPVTMMTAALITRHPGVVLTIVVPFLIALLLVGLFDSTSGK